MKDLSADGAREEQRCATTMHISQDVALINAMMYSPGATDVRTPPAHYEWLWSLPYEHFIAFMQEQAWLLEQYFGRVEIKESYAEETRRQGDCMCCGQATFHWELTANNGICEDCDCMLEARYRQLQYDYPYPSGYHCPVSNLPYPPEPMATITTMDGAAREEQELIKLQQEAVDQHLYSCGCGSCRTCLQDGYPDTQHLLAPQNYDWNESDYSE